MQLDFLRYGFAWITVLLGVALSVIYLLRLMVRHQVGPKFLKKWNSGLRKYHKILGLLMLLTGLVHGLASSAEVLSVNLGTINYLIIILLGLSFMARKKLQGMYHWMYWHRGFTVVLMLTLVLHIMDVGGIYAHKVLFGIGIETEPSTEVPQVTASEGKRPTFDGVILADGTYTGSAISYRPGLVVEVIVSDGQVKDIVVTDHNDVNANFYELPIDWIPGRIVSQQSLDVDTISGATFTSVGIINAVNDALQQAVVSGELPDLESLPTSNKRH